MRERIKVPLSDYFQNEILLPEAIRDYRNSFSEFILLNKAYALMLLKINLLSNEDCKIILKGLNKVKKTLKEEDITGSCEDLFFNIEKTLIGEIGIKIGGKLHTGRSRNDIYSAMTRMEVRKGALAVSEKLLELQKNLLEKSKENIETIITGYTHMQPAQPITLAHYYSALIYALIRDFNRIREAYINTNYSPYGAAAFAGSTFPIDREYLANLTGFDHVMVNSLDSIASKDFVVQMEMAFSLMMINVSRFAEDMYFWSTDEFGIFDIGGQVAICSSIMPQKKNPASLEYAKSKASHTLGTMMSAATILKNVPFSNNEDIFEASGLFQECLEQTIQGIGILTETIRYSKILKEKAFDRAANNYSTVTCLADYLVKNYMISFDESHQIVGSMVGEIIDNGGNIDEMNSKLLAAKSNEVLNKEIHMSDSEIKKVLDPIYNIMQKSTVGSPNPSHVKDMLEELELSLGEQKKWVESAKAKVNESYTKLKEIEEAVIG